jgi:hypothetical protein
MSGGGKENRPTTPKGAASRAASRVLTAPHSDGQKTRPYRASVSASLDTWRRSSVSLKVEGAGGRVSEVVVRPDPAAIAAINSRGDILNDNSISSDSVRNIGGSRGGSDGAAAVAVVLGGGGGGGGGGGDGGGDVDGGDVSDGGDVDVVATTLVFGGVGTPTSVKLRVTGPVNDVHWVSLKRMGGGGGEEAPTVGAPVHVDSP